jgi:hypothetical protein
MHIFAKTAVTALMACTMAGGVAAQDSAFVASEWEYGPAFEVEGEVEIWNTAKQKLLNG